MLELTGHLPTRLSAFGTLGCGGGSEDLGTGVTLRTPDGELLTPKHNTTKFILVELPLFILKMGRGEVGLLRYNVWPTGGLLRHKIEYKEQ